MLDTLFALPPWLKVTSGALAVGLVGLVSHSMSAENITARLDMQASEAIEQAGGKGIRASFTTPGGFHTRHTLLSGGDNLSDEVRERTAKAVKAVPGVGGVHWARGDGHVTREREDVAEPGPFHCQRDVEALLSVRVIRFAQGSAKITPESADLIDEVAAALKPCKGSIIAVSGHSDSVGDAAVNLRLSKERAQAVRDELVRRGLPRASLRAEGYGAARPIEGLAPEDPANRRIEFSVISIAPLAPTPVDTPDAG